MITIQIHVQHQAPLEIGRVGVGRNRSDTVELCGTGSGIVMTWVYKANKYVKECQMLLVTGASLVVTSALLVVTRSY